MITPENFNMKSPSSGFTLLEVLITVVILSIGLLGLAGLQATGMKNNHSAYHRSQATVAAYDIIDGMRANNSAIGNYLSSFMLPTAATIRATCRTTAGCSAALMAENDLFVWNTLITTILPSGVGTITQSGTLYTVTVTWDDDRDGNNGNNPSFNVSFQP